MGKIYDSMEIEREFKTLHNALKEAITSINYLYTEYDIDIKNVELDGDDLNIIIDSEDLLNDIAKYVVCDEVRRVHNIIYANENNVCYEVHLNE